MLINQIKEREHKGSNVYNSFGFALLHSTTNAVKQCLVKVLKPNQDTFTSVDLIGIKIVLLMLIPEKSSALQKRIMSHLSAMLIEDDNFLIDLANCNETNLANIFNDILQQFIINIIKEEE